MAAFKPAYLIHGDDHGRIGERRNRLRALAERDESGQGAEVFAAAECAPDEVARALAAMTFAMGRRFLIVDGVERWSDREVEPLVAALAELPPDTTVAFFAREEGRAKVPAALIAAVGAAGGDVAVESAVKPWELPRFVQAQAGQLGLEIAPAAAKALVSVVGERQQRLVRELEKLALSLPSGARIELDHVEELAAGSAERRAWTLADAIVARDGPGAVQTYLQLRAQGERLPGLLYLMTQRLRTAHDAARRIEAGESAAQVKKGLRMPPRAADRLIADLGRTDAAGLGLALEAMAELELASRGGSSRALTEDTLAVETMTELAAA
jgi:DNA polymerase-3 subunit delta